MELPDEVLVALRGLLAALERVRPAHVSRLRAIAREIQASLEARLKALAPGRYTTQEVRGKLAQVRAVVEVLGVEYGRRIGSEVEAVGRVASQIGRDGLVEQIRAWGPKFPEAARLLSRPREASDVLDPGLLEYYRVSRETYGIEAINKMKGSLAKAALEGKTIVQAWEDMAPAVDLPEWKAERIVRTEQSFASHRRQILDNIDAYGDDAEEIFAKQLVAVFDNRTGEDSKLVHGQVRRLMEPFNDGKRDYQHPPNRPNDREVVVLVLLDEVEGELKGASEGLRAVEPGPIRAASAGAEPVSQQQQAEAPKGVKPNRSREMRRLRRDGRRWTTQLPRRQRAAVYRWTTDWKGIKAASAGAARSRRDEADYLAFKASLEIAPRWSGPVFRGYKTRRLLNIDGQEIDYSKPGTEFAFESLSSVSTEPGVASWFTLPKGDVERRAASEGGVLLVIRPKESLPYIGQGAAKQFRWQEECIFERGSKFRVLRFWPDVPILGDDASRKHHIVEVEEI